MPGLSSDTNTIGSRNKNLNFQNSLDLGRISVISHDLVGMQQEEPLDENETTRIPDIENLRLKITLQLTVFYVICKTKSRS